jgi:general secretion pathway protein I
MTSVGPKRAKAAAFTLIEVMAALVIVSLGMLGVIQAVGQTASNSSYLRDKTLAHWIAMNRLTQTRLERSMPKVDKTSDEVEMAGRRWRWTMQVKQTPVESIRRIDVSVRPADAPEKSSLATVTGFFGSAVAPAGSTLISWQGAIDGQPGGGPGEQGTPETQQPGSTPPGSTPPANPPGTPEPVDPPEDPPEPEEE